jgi:AraC-like DNA-binding protein
MSYLKVDRSILKLKNLTVRMVGHLPGRTSKKRGVLYDYWSCTYIAQGEGTYQFDNGPVQTVKAGCLFWEWPGSSFHFGPSCKEGWDEYYISFEGERINEWLDNGIIAPGKIMDLGLDDAWIRKIAAIGDYMDSGLPENADKAAMLLESFVYDVGYRMDSRASAVMHDTKSEFAARLLEDISTYIYQTWDEREFWERHHISRSTLRRIIREYTGYPLNEYVHFLKISEAKKLLIHTPLQIKQIANMLGYSEVTFFAQVFKKTSGMTAKQFRQKS